MNKELLKLATRFTILPDPMVWAKIGEGSVMSVSLESNGKDKWAIRTHNQLCLGKNLEWDYEPLPSSRTEEWLKAHRFSLEEALTLLGRTDLC